MSGQQPILSVLIPTCQRNHTLGMVLRALRQQTVSRGQFEVLVVEDGPSGSARRATQQAGARYLDVAHDPGPAGTRNAGLEAARGRLILMLGDDMVPTCDLLERHLEAHRQTPGGAVLGRVAWHPGCGVTPLMRHVAERGGQFSFHHIVDPEQCGYRFFYTSNISLERRWLRQERFDPRFYLPSTEDTELGYRLQRRGLVIRYRPRALVWHFHHLERRDYLPRLLHAGEAVHYLVTKHQADHDPRRRLLPFTLIPGGTAAVIAGGFLLSLLPGTRLKWYGVVLGHYARGAARAARRAAVIPDAAKSVTHKSTDRVNWPIPK